jgi:DNA-directed RNA polymerase sigma subunit (sigma70/sigma32)
MMSRPQLGETDRELRRRVDAHPEGLDRLPTERERGIVTMRLGLDGQPPRTLAEIGKVYCISKDRVRQIRDLATARLRWP